MPSRVGADKWLFFITVLLVVAGLGMVFSASVVVAQERIHSPYTFVGKQLLWAAVGFLALIVAMNLNHEIYKSPRFLYPVLVLSVSLLVLVYAFHGSHNTHRWIRFGGFFTFQPSEIAKLVLVLWLAYFLHTRLDRMGDWKRTLPLALAVPAIFIILIVRQRQRHRQRQR